MTGAIITRTGSPARLRVRIIASRRSGAAARGSMPRASSRSSVVTEIPTRARPRAASSPRMSASRSTSAPLVTMVTGWPKSRSTSRTPRMMPKRFSIGW